jgi:hypothetical protein
LVDKLIINNVLSFSTTLKTMAEQSDAKKSTELQLSEFPQHMLEQLVSMMNTAPSLSHLRLLHSTYPYRLVQNSASQKIVEDALKRFQLSPGPSVAASSHPLAIQSITPHASPSGTIDGARVILSGDAAHSTTITVPCGIASAPAWLGDAQFVSTHSQSQTLIDMLASHSISDMCIVGGRGIGKSIVATHFAKTLGYVIEPIMLHRDMTARDLIQQRATLSNGDTTWLPSPIVTAAREGRSVISSRLIRSVFLA